MADLNLRVKVAVDGANKLDSLSGKMSTVGKNLTIGLTAPIIAAGAGFITMAADAEKSQSKLESVFESTEAAAWTSVDALDAHATALSKATTFDDESIKEAQAALLKFGTITGTQFEDATDAAADLAALMETDIATAAGTLGKALADPEAGMGKLAKAGIILTDSQKEAVLAMEAVGNTAGAQQVILDAVSASIGNVAEDLGETSGGKMAIAMNQLAEAGEAIGTFLLPVLTTLAGWLRTLADGFNGLTPEMQGFIVMIAAVIAAVGPVVFLASKVVGAFQAIGVAFRVLSLILLTNPFVALIAAIIAVVALIVLNWDQIVATFKEAARQVALVISRLSTALGNVWDSIVEAATTAWDALVDVIKGAINLAISAINGFIGFLNGFQIHIPAIEAGPIKLPGFDWNGLNIPLIPHLAAGGIVDRATLALLGEKGPEAVIPLDKLQSLQQPDVNVYLTVNGDLKAEEQTLPGIILRTLYASGLTPQ